MEIFSKTGDYAAFVKLLEQGRSRISMRILGYCLMPNHWHLVLWPRRGTDLSRFIGWISTTHVRRWREHRGNRGEGHLYQGRFKSFAVQTDAHLLTVLRYVEGNAVAAGLVPHAPDWPWSSLAAASGADGVRVELAPWPVDRPRNWAAVVDERIEAKLSAQLETSETRGRPFGGDAWVRRTITRHHLEHTLRDPWRPRKTPAKKGSTIAEHQHLQGR